MEGTVDFLRLAGPIENDFVKAWKAAGGRVVGYFCAHAPSELFWAAGILPVRMRGTDSEDTSLADQHLGAFNCSFVRHTLNRLLAGELDFLDGLLVTNSCDHIRRLIDVMSAGRNTLFCHYLDVPHLDTVASLERLKGQLIALKRHIESFFAAAISDEKLAGALELYNRSRVLLQRASQLRCEDPPRARGSEVLAMVVAASSMPKERFNALLEKRLEELEAEDSGAAKRGPRLMVVGGALDDPRYLEVIESLGAHIVADRLCWGAKTFSGLTQEESDPIEAIARRMLENMPCPRMLDAYPRRLAGVLEAIDAYGVDGILCERLKFCDLWGGEIEMLRRSIAELRALPLLVLERDYLTSSGIGQLRTRAQAFLEILRMSPRGSEGSIAKSDG